MILLLGIVVFTGCVFQNNYGKYPFTDVSWERDGGQDNEIEAKINEGYNYICKYLGR